MSHWAAYSGQGLVLNTYEFAIFQEKYLSNVNNGDKGIKELGEYYDGEKTIDEVHFTKPGTDDTFMFFKVDDGSCEGFRLFNYRIDEKKNDKWKQADVPMNNVYVLDAERQMDGMDCFDGPVYTSYEAFVQEFKDKLAAYLPEGFNWDAHIGYYSFACFA